MDETRYPRMLFRGDAIDRADSREEMLAKRAQGWRAKLLPGEAPEDIGEAPEAPSVPAADVAPARAGRGRKPKE